MARLYFLIALTCCGWCGGCAGIVHTVRDELKYNYYEREWQYAEPNAELRYNYMERRWEYTSPTRGVNNEH